MSGPSSAAATGGAGAAVTSAERDNPFRVRGPAVVSFSGGRTSAYMLWRILDAHGGALPPNVVACFANTGREHEATLRFVRDCETRWGVKVHWLEYRLAQPETQDGKARPWTAEVDFASASRNGEPFEAMLRHRRCLPNPAVRFCTTELKVRVIRRWCAQRFGARVQWTQVVGLRADEPRRVAKLTDPARRKKGGAESGQVAVPLAEAGVTKAEVLAFWKAQPFDLELRGEWEGNCDGCMLKRRAVIARLWAEYPERAEWWARMEREIGATWGLRPENRRFRKDWKEGYAGIGARVLNGRYSLLGDPAPDDNGLDLFAACDTGCGT